VIYIAQTLSVFNEGYMDDRDVTILSNYIRETYPDEYDYVSEYNFDKRAYSKGAAIQILERMIYEVMKPPEYITGKESNSPMDVIEEYLIEVNYYAEICDDSRTRFIFTTARDEAKNIMCLYLKGVPNEQSYCCERV
jgi:hypothetical protein